LQYKMENINDNNNNNNNNNNNILIDGNIVMPGDVIINEKELLENSLYKIVGDGFLQTADKLLVTRAGILRISKKKQITTIWLETFQKKYVPAVDDVVIGVIIERIGENYKVDIGSAMHGIMSLYAFEAATKKK